MTITRGKDKSASEETAETATQSSIASGMQPLRHGTKQQARHRASVACASCRDRRIRCVVPKGESECTQCRKAGGECIIKDDDERRRPISKAYMSSLSNRIVMLEGMLLKQGVQPPPAVHPPKSRHEAPMPSGMPHEQQKSLAERCIAPESPSPPESGNEECTARGRDCDDAASETSSGFKSLSSQEKPSFCLPELGVKGIVQRLLSTRETLSFDQFAGRLRFFGPTCNPHACHMNPTDDPVCREPPERIRRAERIIRSLTSTTHDHLMDNFWRHYNSVIKVVDQETFESSREPQDPRFYSTFLHVSILAMGFRFADPGREDTKRIALGNRESSLHREAKRMLDVVLESSGGIPSVQALLLLGDLECGVGRDDTGWMYSGMANRLAFDIGLHIDCRQNKIDHQEALIRRTVMRACVVYDRYWALFLVRPTSIKNQDIGFDLLSRESSQPTSLMGRPGYSHTASKAAEIYDYLVELMSLADCIVETGHKLRTRDALPTEKGEGENNAYIYAIDLDRQFRGWYRRLPEYLQWKPANIKNAPSSYFLLHQQYHVSMILLHLPWARYEEISGDNESTGPYSNPDPTSDSKGPSNQHRNDPLETKSPHMATESSRVASSRRVCNFHAACMAKIFGQHRRKFDGTKIFITAVQHAGTAAIALIAAVAYQHSDYDRRAYIEYLDILVSAIGDMGQTYEPAARMENLLKAVLVQLRTNIGNPSDICRTPAKLIGNEPLSLSTLGWRRSMDSVHLVVPAKREADASHNQPYKRRRPSASDRIPLELDRTSLLCLTDQSQESPHKSSQSHFHVDGRTSYHPNAFTTSGSDGSEFNFALLNGPDHELYESLENKIKFNEDSGLVTTPSDSWPVDTLDESATTLSQQGGFGYGELMSEYSSGTPSISLGSPLTTQNSGRGSEGVGLNNTTASRSITDDRMTHSGTKSEAKSHAISPVAGASCHGSISWAGGEDALNAMCSVSLCELVQNSIADKVARDRTQEIPRNHELDFLSL